MWIYNNHHDTSNISIPTVLDYLLHIRCSGLTHSSIKLHLSAISAFLPLVDGTSVFSHPTSARFLHGLLNTFLLVREPNPVWDFNLVLSALSKPQFEPLATYPLTYLSKKVIFLVSVTSAWRLSELAAMMAHPPFTVFHMDKVTLQFNPRFLPKVASPFHLSQVIHLPVFYPKPHSSKRERTLYSLNVRHALTFYLYCTCAYGPCPGSLSR